MRNTNDQDKKITKALIKAKFSKPQAKVIMRSIKSMFEELYSSNITSNKLDRIKNLIDFRIAKVKSKFIKLIIGIIFFNLLFKFAFSHWGI